MSDLTDRIDGLKELVARADDFKPIISAAKDAFAELKDLFGSLDSGDVEAVQVAMTRWAEVNKTLMAVQDMDAELQKSGFDWDKGLSIVMKLVQAGVKVAGVIG